MAYKRQTSFTPFNQKRQVVDESKELKYLAKALEGERKSVVKDFTVASNQQINEMGRIDTLSAKKDTYEIQQLANFSKSLNSALQVGSRVLGGQYIDNQEAKGAKAFADDPVDVDQLKIEINTLRAENLDALDEIEAASKKDHLLSLEEKLQLHQARMRRGSFGHGYTRAYLQEVGNGFLPHLMQETSGGENWYQQPDVDENDNVIEGTGIRFKDYNGQTYETKRLMEDKILDNYKLNNNLTGIKADWENKYVNDPAKKILNKWSAQQLQNSIVEEARLQREGFSREIGLDINEWTFKDVIAPIKEGEEGYEDYIKQTQAITSMQKNIQIFMNRVPIAYANGGTPDGQTANQASTALLRKTLTNGLVEMTDDKTRNFLIDSILGNESKGIKPMIFKTSVGNKPLTFFETFDKKAFELDVMNEVVEARENKVKENKSRLTTSMYEALIEFRSGDTAGNYRLLEERYKEITVDPYFAVDTPHGNNITKLYEAALAENVVKKLSTVDSKEKAKELVAQWGKIPVSVAIKNGLDNKTINRYQQEGLILADDYTHWIDENKGEWQTKIKDISDTYLTVLTGGKTANANFKQNSAAYELAASTLSSKTFLKQINSYLNNPEWQAQQNTDDFNTLFGNAVDAAHSNILAEIPNVSNTDLNIRKNSWLHAEGYGVASFKPDGTAKFDTPDKWSGDKYKDDLKILDKGTKINEGIANWLKSDESGEGVLSGKLLSSQLGSTIDESQLEVLLNGTPIVEGDKVTYNSLPQWAVAASREDSNGITALQIWNADRKAHGFTEITVDQLAPYLQSANNFVNQLSKDDKILIQNGKVEIVFDKNNLISVEYLTNAMNSFEDLDIPAAKVMELANDLKIDYNLLYNAKGEPLDSGVPLMDKIKRNYFNDLLAEATKGATNKQEALQNFYSLASGQSKSSWQNSRTTENKGLKFIEAYNSNGGELAGYDIAYAIKEDPELKSLIKSTKYMDTDLDKYLTIDFVEGIEAKELARLENKAKETLSWDDYYDYKTKDLTANSLESIETKISTLEATRGDINFKTNSKGDFIYPEAKEFDRTMSELTSQQNIISLMEGGVGDTDWGLRAAIDDNKVGRAWLERIFSTPGVIAAIPRWTKDFRVISDIENALEPGELSAMKKLAAKNAGLSGVPDSLEMAFTVPNIKKEIEEAYITEFYKLLLIHPKFYTGNTYGVD